MQVLVGSQNRSKMQEYKDLLAPFGVDVINLLDLGIDAKPSETGGTPEENARIKASFYSQFAPHVISSDSGLYFMELSEDDPAQPGLYVRRKHQDGEEMNDEEMIEYYCDLINRHGGKLTAFYRDGYAIARNGHIETFMRQGEIDLVHSFYMVGTASPKRHIDWPLDSLSVEPKSGKYYIDLDEAPERTEHEQTLWDDYQRQKEAFIIKALGLKVSLHK